MHQFQSGYLERAHRSDTLCISSETSLQQHYDDREFIETVELLLRKSVDFLANFHESSLFKLSNINQRITSIERKLDFIEASLQNCDPSSRGIEPIPIQNSVFNKAVRNNLLRQHQIERSEPRKNSMCQIKNVVKPQKNALRKTIKISMSNIDNQSNQIDSNKIDIKINKMNSSEIQKRAGVENIACDNLSGTHKNDKMRKPKSIIISKPNVNANANVYAIDVSKYNKMKRIGLPLVAIINKMKMDGIALSVINKWSGENKENEKEEETKSITPSPTLSSIDSTYFNKEGRINRTGSLHRKYGAPPQPSRSPSPIPKKLPIGLAAQIKNANKLKLLESVKLNDEIKKDAIDKLASVMTPPPPPPKSKPAPPKANRNKGVPLRPSNFNKPPPPRKESKPPSVPNKPKS